MFRVLVQIRPMTSEPVDSSRWARKTSPVGFWGDLWIDNAWGHGHALWHTCNWVFRISKNARLTILEEPGRTAENF